MTATVVEIKTTLPADRDIAPSFGPFSSDASVLVADAELLVEEGVVPVDEAFPLLVVAESGAAPLIALDLKSLYWSSDSGLMAKTIPV